MEVRFLREGAADSLDDDVGCVVPRPDALLQWAFHHQLGQEAWGGGRSTVNATVLWIGYRLAAQIGNCRTDEICRRARISNLGEWGILRSFASYLFFNQLCCWISGVL